MVQQEKQLDDHLAIQLGRLLDAISTEAVSPETRRLAEQLQLALSARPGLRRARP